MMKPIQLFLTLGIGMIIGGILAWNLKPAATQETTKNTSKATSHSRPPAQNTDRFSSEIKSIKDGTFVLDTTDKNPDLNHLESLAVAMMKNAGSLMDFTENEHRLLSQILYLIAEKDLTRALALIDRIPYGQPFRSFFYENAINKAMGDSPIKDRLAVFKSRDVTPDQISKYAGSLLFTHEPLNTELALYLLGHIQAKPGLTSGYTNFEKGFDYKAFADASLQIARSNGNFSPNSYPANFFKEWTRSDPQAAMEFYFSNCLGSKGVKLGRESVTDVMNGLYVNIPPEDYTHFLGAAINQQLLAENPDKDMIQDLITAGLSKPELLVASLEEIQDPTLRQKLMEETLAYTSGASAVGSEDVSQLRGTLELYPDPQSRLEGVRKYAQEISGRNGDRDGWRMIDNLCSQMAILGHSAADIQQIRTAAGRYGQ